jgi:excisionase family DNA binding protein
MSTAMPSITPPLLYTIKEAAAMLKWSESTLRRRIRSGEIRPFRSGRLVRISHDSLMLLIGRTS